MKIENITEVKLGNFYEKVRDNIFLNYEYKKVNNVFGSTKM
jgi:hypothetical protein